MMVTGDTLQPPQYVLPRNLNGDFSWDLRDMDLDLVTSLSAVLLLSNISRRLCRDPVSMISESLLDEEGGAAASVDSSSFFTHIATTILAQLTNIETIL